MSYNLQEQKVLNFLDKENFKNISRKELMSIASDFKNYSPEIQAKVLDALPQISGLIESSNETLKEVSEKVIESDEKSTSELNELYGKSLDQIGEELKNESLDPEERMQLRSDRMKILESAKDTNEKQREFKGNLLGWLGKTVGIGILIVGGSLLGVKISGVSLPWDKD